MSKKFNSQVMKFEITDDALLMKIKLKDLAWLLKHSPNNMNSTGTGNYCHVQKGKNKEFAEYLVKMLMDESTGDGDNARWIEPFESIFSILMESAEDEFIKYDEFDK